MHHITRPVESMRRGITHMGLLDQCTGLSASGADIFAGLGWRDLVFGNVSHFVRQNRSKSKKRRIFVAHESAIQNLGCAGARVAIHLGSRDLDQPQVLPVLSCFNLSPTGRMAEGFSPKAALALVLNLFWSVSLVVN